MILIEWLVSTTSISLSVPQTTKILHETVQFRIQTIPEEEETEKPLFEDEFEVSGTGRNKRRRQTFVTRDDELTPYHKKTTR